ncbi:hypothetical protein F7734_23620 [Scytonema sp. UIC 10036]|uniref:hypothetical protein n=1 Tax=Scytonema sp. UIC 10036 TaxID=2304196 RepID=UPI0012DA5E0D|nr:hypothetical protein [Scytonema sp. UIC 10036]MUG95183.1 hypothetical protein [Scytonema sp. UIC 10036]QGX02581.1 ScdE precursor [Scytonema sp. UIC 10036]
MRPENQKENRCLQPKLSEPAMRSHAGMPVDLSEEELTAEVVNGGVFASMYGGTDGGVTASISPALLASLV